LVALLLTSLTPQHPVPFPMGSNNAKMTLASRATWQK